MTALLLDSALRVSLVTAITLLALVLLRRRSAAMRHWVLASATACALLMPVLQPLVPSWQVAVPVPSPFVRDVGAPATAAAAAGSRAGTRCAI